MMAESTALKRGVVAQVRDREAERAMRACRICGRVEHPLLRSIAERAAWHGLGHVPPREWGIVGRTNARGESARGESPC
jgi:hypothetical protein